MCIILLVDNQIELAFFFSPTKCMCDVLLRCYYWSKNKRIEKIKNFRPACAMLRALVTPRYLSSIIFKCSTLIILFLIN